MSTSAFKVIKGGLASCIRDMPKHFVYAYVTDTRLMGVLDVYARWRIAGSGQEAESLHQFFYIDCEESGLETYQGIRGDNTALVESAEQALIGGLGAQKTELDEGQFRALMCKYKRFNEKRGLPLPADKGEYGFIFYPEITMSREEEHELMAYICDEIKSDYQAVNYFLMRCFGQDYEGARFLAPVTHPAGPNAKQARRFGPLTDDFPLDLYHDYVKATFCKNVIDVEKIYDDGGVSYLCESLIEMDGSYDIVVSKVVVRDLRIIGFEHCSGFGISPAEAAMMLAKPEYCTAYEVLLSEEEVEDNIGEFTMIFNTIMSVQKHGRLFMSFRRNNAHVNDRVFMLSNDVQGVYFLTDYGQLIIAAYDADDVKRLESTLSQSLLAPYLEATGRYAFKDPLLFEFIKSDFEDFDDFLEFLGIL